MMKSKTWSQTKNQEQHLKNKKKMNLMMMVTWCIYNNFDLDEVESRKNPIQDFHSVKQNSRFSTNGALELSIGRGSQHVGNQDFN
jgi:hypothetical protein